MSSEPKVDLTPPEIREKAKMVTSQLLPQLLYSLAGGLVK